MPSLIKISKLYFLIFIKYGKRYWRSLGLILLLIVVAIFTQKKFNLIQNQQIISEGLVGTYQEHDLPPEVIELISDGLVGFDQDGRMIPKLVSGWEKNNDATQFTFKLKGGLRWIDGMEVKSTDLEFTIPNTEVSYPDDQTVQFKLKDSYSPFPSLLIKPVFKKGTLVGVGPYKIKNIEKSRVFITKIILTPARENLPQVIIRFYPNEKTALTGFVLGETESLLGINFNQSYSNQLTKWRQKTDYTKIVTIMYSTKDPVLGNRSLRQALSYVSPKFDQEIIAGTPIVPFSWAFDSGGKKYLANFDEAKGALQRAKTAATDLESKQIVLTTAPQLEEVGKQVINDWKKLGLNVVLRVEPGIAQNFQALLIIQSIPTDPDQYFLWHSTQTKTNLTKYSQARVDKDLEDGRKTTSEEERKVKYQDFQKVLLEDSPATFLYFPKYNVLYLKKAEDNLNKVLPLQLP